MRGPIDCIAALPKRFPQVRRWCIAFSGGLDSQVLLSVAAQVLPLSSLVVVHVNHQLQPDAEAWEGHCQSQAGSLGVAFQAHKVQPNDASEAAARDARYAVFKRVLQSGDALLMAHHADDQAETLVFRMCRGAGVTGLSGMHDVRSFEDALLIRPFLKLSRQSLHTWAVNQKLSWIEDPSNASVQYDRNYIRLEILPRLASRWPKIGARLSATASHLREAQTLLDEVAQSDLQQCCEMPEVLTIPLLERLSLARIHNVLRFWLTGFNHRLSETQLKQIKVQFFQTEGNPERELWLSKRYCLRTYRKRLFVCTTAPGNQSAAPLAIKMFLAVGELTLPTQLLEHSDPLKIISGLTAEKIQPAGRLGRKRLSQVFQEAGVPPWLRQEWPLICDSEGVLLVPGICFVERYPKKMESVGTWQPFGLSGAPFFVSLQYHLDPS